MPAKLRRVSQGGQANGKIERFHRTLGDGWACARFCDSAKQRDDASPGRKGQHRGRDPGVYDLRAAAHPIGQRFAGNAVPSAEFLKLLKVNVIGQDPQRLVSLLQVTHATQEMNQPLPAIPHLHHQACL